ncbi:hypothetical protein QQP08_004919 [Theobroma cacao]|nr:hypothetical protein QQP08_004919 [Theobroma cacao]
MAQQHQLITAAVVVFFLIISTASGSSARLLNGFLSHGLQAATEPTLNLALPLDSSDDVVVTTTSQEKDPNHHQQQVLPCDHMVTIKNSHTGTLMRSPRLAGKYGPMILSMLPREPVPSSGPSKGTNDIKN